MIRTLAVTHDHTILQNIPLEALTQENVLWYWVDFHMPDEREGLELDRHFKFHPLAIDDCFHLLQRPKLDHYDGYHFFVFHSVNPATLAAREVDLFLGSNYVVTFHQEEVAELDEVWKRFSENDRMRGEGAITCMYMILDKLVDYYFPCVQRLEDELAEVGEHGRRHPVHLIMDRLYEIRINVLKLRKTIIPMRDLLYRIVNSQKIEGMEHHVAYFKDIHDHLLKLSEMLESNREMSSDIRDSYLSLNSYRMNSIMKTLTVITTIFMPLTFIAGVYGMNFQYMPELEWENGYYIVLSGMLVIGIGMYWWFKRKGWF
ncbi:magnesium/cobalt transporter CorA [Paenibacillus turpanensis]|uniref:magnesium/cobalt transporter CorA n=1 Tax=Paenibacillus turpanensis TaxID=2689078 RepID=UPI0014099076|nr:magnesium/cobalt transporter CorA [Paenibacillus turpanensis]